MAKNRGEILRERDAESRNALSRFSSICATEELAPAIWRKLSPRRSLMRSYMKRPRSGSGEKERHCSDEREKDCVIGCLSSDCLSDSARWGRETKHPAPLPERISSRTTTEQHRVAEVLRASRCGARYEPTETEPLTTTCRS